jgi:uncharacterized SAM-dependent methyltransferase
MEKIELVAEEDLETMFYESLMKHQLPDYFLYMGSEGAKNWLSLDRSEKFTVARQLTQLLQENTSDIGNLIPEDMNFVSVGVGNGEKERIILKELINKYIPTYYPVDINGTLVDMAMQTVQELPVEKKGIVGFIEDMPLLKNLWNPPDMFSILGNTFCNYEPDYILNLIHENLDDGDLFLFDCHLLPESGDIESAKKVIKEIYRSRENTIFNEYPLVRYGMNPNSFHFHLDLVPIKSTIGMLYRTHKTLHISEDSFLTIGLNTVSFRSGDIVQLGFTYKYTLEQIMTLLDQADFDLIKYFLSNDRTNAIILSKKKSINGG